MADNITSNECFLCGPFEVYAKLTADFAQNSSVALEAPMEVLFMSCVGLWVVVSGLRLALMMAGPKDIMKEFVFVFISAAILQGYGPDLVTKIFDTAIKIMSGSAAAAFTATGIETDVEMTGSSINELGILILHAEKGVGAVLEVAVAMTDTLNPAKFVAGVIVAILMILPYVILLVTYFSQVVVAVFRLMMISIFAPFLFLAFGFNWGREMAKAGAKAVLSSVMVLFACTVALSLAFYGVNIFFEDFVGTGHSAGDIAVLTSPKLITIIVLGWLGTALMTEATSIANSITGSLLTNTAAGIMTAGITGSALAAASLAAKASPLGMAAGLAGMRDGTLNSMAAASSVASDIRNPSNLVKRYKNIKDQEGQK